MPYIINGVAVALTFQYFYNFRSGALNTILEAIGLVTLKQNWLGNPDLINFCLSFTSLWKYSGQHIIIFIAAIISIPTELYEAAEIDGVSSFQKYLYITIPGIATVINLLLFLFYLFGFSHHNQIFS